MVRSYSTGQQEPRPYSPPTLANNTLLSLHQPDNSTPLLQGGSLMGLEEDTSVEEDQLGQQDKMDIEVSPPSPSPPTSRWLKTQLLNNMPKFRIKHVRAGNGVPKRTQQCPFYSQLRLPSGTPGTTVQTK